MGPKHRHGHTIVLLFDVNIPNLTVAPGAAAAPNAKSPLNSAQPCLLEASVVLAVLLCKRCTNCGVAAMVQTAHAAISQSETADQSPPLILAHSRLRFCNLSHLTGPADVFTRCQCYMHGLGPGGFGGCSPNNSPAPLPLISEDRNEFSRAQNLEPISFQAPNRPHLGPTHIRLL